MLSKDERDLLLIVAHLHVNVPILFGCPASFSYSMQLLAGRPEQFQSSLLAVGVSCIDNFQTVNSFEEIQHNMYKAPLMHAGGLHLSCLLGTSSRLF